MIENVKKSFLRFFFSRKELNIIYYEHVDLQVKIGKGFKGYNPDTDEEFDISDQEQSVYHYLWRVKNGAWRVVECEPIISQIKTKGYDGFYVIERGSKNVAIFDESSIENFNKYDTSVSRN